MKHSFTQTELAAFYHQGSTILVGFRSAASIVWSHGTRELILSPLPKKQAGLPFTVRGRATAVTPENYNAMINH